MNDQVDTNTHLMIVNRTITEELSDDPKKNHDKPHYFNSIKEATDKAHEIIKECPSAECDIYQIRVRLKGKIEIDEKHFNTSK